MLSATQTNMSLLLRRFKLSSPEVCTSETQINTHSTRAERRNRNKLMATSSIFSPTNLTTQSPAFSPHNNSDSSSSHLSFSRSSSISLQKFSLSTAFSHPLPRTSTISSAVQHSGPVSKAPDSDPALKPTILVSEKLGEAGLDLLRSFGNTECLYDLSPADLCAKIAECDALIVRSGTKVTRQVFEAAKGRLKVVGRAGVGIDNVDLQAATEFGCLVVNAPTANTIAAAEHGIALLAAMARNVAQSDASMKDGTNSGSPVIPFCGFSIDLCYFGKESKTKENSPTFSYFLRQDGMSMTSVLSLMNSWGKKHYLES